MRTSCSTGSRRRIRSTLSGQSTSDGGNYTKDESGKKDGEIGVLLEEIRNPADPSLRAGLNGELGFNSERFAPLLDNEDEILRTAEKEDKDLVPA